MILERLMNDEVGRALPLAVGLAYLPHIVKGLLISSTGYYDNKAPREMDLERIFVGKPKLLELSKRCRGCHTNGFESLTVFGPSLAFAVARGVPASVLGPLCTQFIALRAVYTVAYLGGVNDLVSVARSIVWSASLYICFKMVTETVK